MMRFKRRHLAASALLHAAVLSGVAAQRSATQDNIFLKTCKAGQGSATLQQRAIGSRKQDVIEAREALVSDARDRLEDGTFKAGEFMLTSECIDSLEAGQLVDYNSAFQQHRKLTQGFSKAVDGGKGVKETAKEMAEGYPVISTPDERMTEAIIDWGGSNHQIAKLMFSVVHDSGAAERDGVWISYPAEYGPGKVTAILRQAGDYYDLVTGEETAWVTRGEAGDIVDRYAKEHGVETSKGKGVKLIASIIFALGGIVVGLIPTRRRVNPERAKERQELKERAMEARMRGELRLGEFLIMAAHIDAKDRGKGFGLEKALARYDELLDELQAALELEGSMPRAIPVALRDIKYRMWKGSIADALIGGSGNCVALAHLVSALVYDSGHKDVKISAFINHLSTIYHSEGKRRNLVSGLIAYDKGKDFMAEELIVRYRDMGGFLYPDCEDRYPGRLFGRVLSGIGSFIKHGKEGLPIKVPKSHKPLKLWQEVLVYSLFGALAVGSAFIIKRCGGFGEEEEHTVDVEKQEEKANRQTTNKKEERSSFMKWLLEDGECQRPNEMDIYRYSPLRYRSERRDGLERVAVCHDVRKNDVAHGTRVLVDAKDEIEVDVSQRRSENAMAEIAHLSWILDSTERYERSKKGTMSEYEYADILGFKADIYGLMIPLMKEQKMPKAAASASKRRNATVDEGASIVREWTPADIKRFWEQHGGSDWWWRWYGAGLHMISLGKEGEDMLLQSSQQRPNLLLYLLLHKPTAERAVKQFAELPYPARYWIVTHNRLYRRSRDPVPELGEPENREEFCRAYFAADRLRNLADRTTGGGLDFHRMMLAVRAETRRMGLGQEWEVPFMIANAYNQWEYGRSYWSLLQDLEDGKIHEENRCEMRRPYAAELKEWADGMEPLRGWQDAEPYNPEHLRRPATLGFAVRPHADYKRILKTLYSILMKEYDCDPSWKQD